MSTINRESDPALSYRNLQEFFEGIAATGNGDSVYASEAAYRCHELADHFSGHRPIIGELDSKKAHVIAAVGWACRKGYIPR